MSETDLSNLAGKWFQSGVEALAERERAILDAVLKRERVSRPPAQPDVRTLGERMADRVAEFGGSWTFIAMFSAFLVAWAILNTLMLRSEAFDPYPYVFLNLILSMIAAVQAPIIMMSQNRQAKKDRETAEHDYEVNLKAEIEILGLHEKLDDLRSAQIARLLTSQQQQLDILTALLKRSER